MRKLILLFLLSVAGYGQTANGTETKQNAFRSLNPQTVVSPVFVTTMGADGTMGKASVNNLPLSTVTIDSLATKANNSLSGIISALGYTPANDVDALKATGVLNSGFLIKSIGGKNTDNSVIYEASGKIGISGPSLGETLGINYGTDATIQLKLRNNNSLLSFEQVPDHNRILSLNLDSSASKDFVLGGYNATPYITMKANGNVLIANNPDNGSRFQVNGKIYSNKSIQTSDDTDVASSSNAGSIRYRLNGNNSYIDVVMQTGASTYEWVNIIQNNW